ncbi:MAG: hypothetical protein AMS18_00480 [Gemmatimonas sp. SG8_17]|nr:MAG: hypothetical protein AMS18_00480 [Gemmatimonas sp. SG8_17]
MVQFRNDETKLELDRNMAGVFELAQGEVTCTTLNTDYTYRIQDYRTGFLVLIAQGADARYDLLGTTGSDSNWLPADVPTKVRAPMRRYGVEGPKTAGRDMWSPAGLEVHFQAPDNGTKITVIETLGAQPGTFLPTAINGLVLWLRSSSIALAANSSVSSWEDESGANNHAIQATPANQPTLVYDSQGRKAVRFGASSHKLVIDPLASSILPISVFTVVTPRSEDEQRMILDKGPTGDATTRFIMYRETTDTWNLGPGSAPPTGGTVVSGQTDIVSGLHKIGADECILRENGTQIDTGTTNITAALESLHIGCDQTSARQFNGDLLEIAMYDHELTAAQFDLVDGYLSRVNKVALA